MSWFRQNRFLGTFLIVFALATIASAFFVWSAKSQFDDAETQFNQSATELARLQRLTPFPTETNLQKMKLQTQDYAADLNKLKHELQTRVLAVTPMAPNEFQTRLLQARTGLIEKARVNKVKLPEIFYLGFDEFATALPDTAAAPLLGQQLAQAELLVSILIDARVDAVTSFRRVIAIEPPAALTPIAERKTPATDGPPLIERNLVEAAFLATPSAARRALNQIATNNQQFYILRTLHVLNEKEKGPPRQTTAPVPSPGAASSSPVSALNFIVGNERIQTLARVEMVRFTY